MSFIVSSALARIARPLTRCWFYSVKNVVLEHFWSRLTLVTVKRFQDQGHAYGTQTPHSSAHHPKVSGIDVDRMYGSSAAQSDKRNEVCPLSPRTKIKLKRSIGRTNDFFVFFFKWKKNLENTNNVFLLSLTCSLSICGTEKWKATDSIWPSEKCSFLFIYLFSFHFRTGGQRCVFQRETESQFK